MIPCHYYRTILGRYLWYIHIQKFIHTTYIHIRKICVQLPLACCSSACTHVCIHVHAMYQYTLKSEGKQKHVMLLAAASSRSQSQRSFLSFPFFLAVPSRFDWATQVIERLRLMGGGGWWVTRWLSDPVIQCLSTVHTSAWMCLSDPTQASVL